MPANGQLTATYSYLANSPLVQQITFQNGGTTRMTTAKQYDYLNRLTGISSTPSASWQIGFSYGYNQANQRTNVTLGRTTPIGPMATKGSREG